MVLAAGSAHRSAKEWTSCDDAVSGSFARIIGRPNCQRYPFLTAYIYRMLQFCKTVREFWRERLVFRHKSLRHFDKKLSRILRIGAVFRSAGATGTIRRSWWVCGLLGVI